MDTARLCCAPPLVTSVLRRLGAPGQARGGRRRAKPQGKCQTSVGADDDMRDVPMLKSPRLPVLKWVAVSATLTSGLDGTKKEHEVAASCLRWWHPSLENMQICKMFHD
jgi:hypothetical protein